MYVIYVKKFIDGSVYIGSTNNFIKRMKEHSRDAKSGKNKHLPINIKLRECDYIDLVLVKNIPTLKLALFLEEEITKSYREHNYNVLNILDGRKRNDGINNNPLFNLKGEQNLKAKSKDYYETHPTLRSSFKRTCHRMDWNFDDFEEVFAEWYIRPNDNTKRKKNYYIFKK